MRFYNEIPDMECLAGDTLPEFRVTTGMGLTDGRMEVIIAKEKAPSTEIICKTCDQDISGIFRVQLTSDDTRELKAGQYMLHFRLTDSHGHHFRKLAGRLCVRPAARGGY